MTAAEWAEKIRAARDSLIGIPYSKLDCQAFVEYCWKHYAGIVKDYRGSNDMWRNAVNSQSDDFSTIEGGELVFTIKHDGKEPARYTDGVNAAHVGIYIGNDEVIHSTTGGVQMDTITNKRWTHHAKCNCLTYGKADDDADVYKQYCLNMYSMLKEMFEGSN